MNYLIIRTGLSMTIEAATTKNKSWYTVVFIIPTTLYNHTHSSSFKSYITHQISMVLIFLVTCTSFNSCSIVSNMQIDLFYVSSTKILMMKQKDNNEGFEYVSRVKEVRMSFFLSLSFLSHTSIS